MPADCRLEAVLETSRPGPCSGANSVMRSVALVSDDEEDVVVVVDDSGVFATEPGASIIVTVLMDSVIV
jgi:hypothetical protein